MCVVLTYNSESDVSACLDSLQAQPEVDVLVVDNASSDRTLEVVREGEWDVEVVESGANLGYAGGINLGIQLALDRGYRFVFVLNPDATVERGALSTLLAHMRSTENVGAVCPVILDALSGDVWFRGGDINWGNGETVHVNSVRLDDSNLSTTERISGAAVLIRREAIEQTGLLDENYFLYYEETDWSVRMRLRGWRLAVAHDAFATHAPSSSTGGINSPIYRYYMTRNRIYFLERHRTSRIAAVVRTLPLALREMKFTVSSSRWSNIKRMTSIVARAYFDAIGGRGGRRDLAPWLDS